eukprot:1260342-Pleurochrysis_carterae.AAC.1
MKYSSSCLSHGFDKNLVIGHCDSLASILVTLVVRHDIFSEEGTRPMHILLFANGDTTSHMKLGDGTQVKDAASPLMCTACENTTQ